jgi:DNA-binding NtrC family response regulator
MPMRTPCAQQPSLVSFIAPVLIVDDEPAVRKVLATLLSQAGISSKVAANPQEALLMLETTAFEAVISDLRMGAASGFDLLQQVRNRFPNLPFLMGPELMTSVSECRP